MKFHKLIMGICSGILIFGSNPVNASTPDPSITDVVTVVGKRPKPSLGYANILIAEAMGMLQQAGLSNIELQMAYYDSQGEKNLLSSVDVIAVKPKLETDNLERAAALAAAEAAKALAIQTAKALPQLTRQEALTYIVNEAVKSESKVGAVYVMWGYMEGYKQVARERSSLNGINRELNSNEY
ncbi:MAG: hypothetical protein AB8E15_05315 [Bdellovibrionales bacterium]